MRTLADSWCRLVRSIGRKAGHGARQPSDTGLVYELVRELATDPELQSVYDECRSLASAHRTGRGARTAPVARTRARWFLVPAAVAAAGAVGVLVLHVKDTVRYETAVGEQRTIIASDDSVITLNTDSEVRVRMDRDVRRIWLDRGQAFFSVTPDKERPFEVFANDGVVRAVGTSFDVALGREPGTVKVTVVEGSVEILPRIESAASGSVERAASKLVHGESATYRSGGAVERVTSAGFSSALAWRDGKMDFDNQRLIDALAEHNRYTNKKIVLGDDNLKELRISGTLRIGDTRGFLFLLKESLGLTVVEQPEVFILLSSSGSLNANSPGQHPGGV